VGTINYGRVVVAGLVAGFVANIVDFVSNAFLLADAGAAMAQRLNLDPAVMNSTSSLVTWVAIDFVYGLVIVFTYAAIRPRLGPGPTTAIIAGLVPFVSVSLVIYGFTTMGIFTPDLFIKSTALALVANVAASLAGGAAYKE
jgi:hypothetical protein